MPISGDATPSARPSELRFVDTGGSVRQTFIVVDGEAVRSPDGTSAPAVVLRFDPWDGSMDPTTARWKLAVPARPEDPAGTTSLVDFDLTGLTQYGSPYAVSAIDRDGYPAGELQQIVIDGDDLIRLRFSNGQERNLGRMLLAQFSVADRMRAVGQNGWLCEEQCTGPRFASPTTQLTDQVRSGFLEATDR